MREAKRFHIGDIISAGAGVLVSPRLLEGVYDILSFMAGEPVFTHQIPRIGKEARVALLRQNPSLGRAFDETKDVTPDNWRSWLDRWIERHGEYMLVIPMTEDEHEYREPVSELAEKMHPDKIVVLKP
jgi:hypothetical protein